MQLKNLTIRKVFEGTKGEGKHGPWILYNLYFDGNEKWKDIKFGYFRSASAAPPEEGAEITAIEFESKKSEDGKYTNYTISKMHKSEPEPEPEPVSQTNDNNRNQNGSRDNKSMYYSYAKDLVIARMGLFKKADEIPSTPELAERIAEAGEILYQRANGATEPVQESTKGLEEPKQEPEEPGVSAEPEDDIPF